MTEALPPTMREEEVPVGLNPRQYAQSLDSYMDNHQIQPFVQEMLSEVFAVLPEDPYEYMTHHLASRRPVRPPKDDTILACGVLWVLLPGGDPMSPEQWRLRRCWLTDKAVLCVSNAAADVEREVGGGVVISPPNDPAPQEYPLEKGATHRELEDDEACKPFAFSIAVQPGPLAHKGDKELKNGRWILQLAASSEEQRSDWFSLFAPFKISSG
mmetsp:Transcript_53357/g.95768  ORF Transcript_53357/g.95768 Transcript_53357/m.95768 type:complete len:213 (+) Transcript_53357:27-665(+)|eukprot:CAMPEP_0197660082 /NCGR_PEP_ID=MMETSP1338-20131121/50371_1 /TAXON_ID=43686 ORGANISM="Pelagodinium beii, Strain RCC1491" /NCGR_SAMPLE_ID=MMETSP1338 /ASSEMBLY_ACC=CAM_ASM_000754 /LENGTH=212 /DNA_ID=CAMNT_0043237327 /DNA_START=27 /DNA_END=665 /DNA_ORIENTATION=+